MAFIHGSHHITLCVGTAQEDVDFHTKTLGMRFIKRTVLFDGATAIYHLYYSNATGDPSSVVTTFPFAQAGLYGTQGTNQAREVLLSVPAGSGEYWQKRLAEHGIDAVRADVAGTHRVVFRHPCGLEYSLVEVTGDPREGYTRNGVPAEYAVHGIYGVGIHVTTPDRTVEFADTLFFNQAVGEEDGRITLRPGEAQYGNTIELIPDTTSDQGTWHFGAGTIHHTAWNAGTLENQTEVKFDIEGAGYTDISELKDRKYFKSVYVRTPSGALFEIAVTHAEGGWDCDESPEELGSRFQLPPQFEDRRDEILDSLEPIEV
ncbi:VOC family protein [Microcella daejeonensis]|uniref:VOC family protein n=1 Tax=Microcella daejeonensis TaxID=2994971 RepID=A0A9E8SAB1_9MICO|nr:VOC family protein [Microcella daejeonensis]WAB80482.1 VOC family protein [Microcella daejeonensis]